MLAIIKWFFLALVALIFQSQMVALSIQCLTQGDVIQAILGVPLYIILIFTTLGYVSFFLYLIAKRFCEGSDKARRLRVIADTMLRMMKRSSRPIAAMIIIWGIVCVYLIVAEGSARRKSQTYAEASIIGREIKY